jgi:hypothetical protein
VHPLDGIVETSHIHLCEETAKTATNLKANFKTEPLRTLLPRHIQGGYALSYSKLGFSHLTDGKRMLG